MVLALASLALGLWAGLDLIGWRVAPPSATIPAAHGVLMVNGVLASLIGLERAVALRRSVFYLAPILSGAGALYLAVGGRPEIAFLVVALGAVGLLVLFAIILYRQPALYTVTMVLGSAALVVGDARGPSVAVAELIPWWASFLVLVIAAERLELARIAPQTNYDRAIFAFTVALALAGAALSTFAFATGFLFAAAGWFLTGVWLLVHDLAPRNLGRPGLPRFTALALLAGFLWLLIGAGLILLEGGVLPGLTYDAALHAIFLGFVLSLVLGHALVIVPAVLGVPLPFHPAVYVPLALLHASLAARFVGDLARDPLLRAWGGLFNVVAIVLFGLLLLALARRARTSLSPALDVRPDGPPA